MIIYGGLEIGQNPIHAELRRKGGGDEKDTSAHSVLTRQDTEGRTTRSSQHAEHSGHSAKQLTDDTERGLSKKELTSVWAFQPCAALLWTADLTALDMEDYFFCCPSSLWQSCPVPSLSLQPVRECSGCLPALTWTRPASPTGFQFLSPDGMDFSSPAEPGTLCHSHGVKLLSQAFTIRYSKAVLAAFRLTQCVPCVDEFEIAVLCHASSVLPDLAQFTSEAEFPPGTGVWAIPTRGVEGKEGGTGEEAVLPSQPNRAGRLGRCAAGKLRERARESPGESPEQPGRSEAVWCHLPATPPARGPSALGAPPRAGNWSRCHHF